MHESENNISIDLCDSTLKNNLLGNGFVRADLTDFQHASVDAFASKLPNISTACKGVL